MFWTIAIYICISQGEVKQRYTIHRLNLFWSAKKHLATSGEPAPAKNEIGRLENMK